MENMHEIVQVKVAEGERDANKLLGEGWILLSCSVTEDGRGNYLDIYILGWSEKNG